MSPAKTNRLYGDKHFCYYRRVKSHAKVTNRRLARRRLNACKDLGNEV